MLIYHNSKTLQNVNIVLDFCDKSAASIRTNSFRSIDDLLCGIFEIY